jgi:hypothetical protein
MFIAQSSATSAAGYVSWSVIIGTAVVLLGVALGLGDLRRISLTRALAIAGVCFTQSLRRRVYLVIPLVVAAIIAAGQFQKADDAQDAIRQTLNACLFATGFVVTLVILMVACTSIPREIDNRVIYTITTKPVTRLEIVLGKAMGFSWVSFWMLLVMGLFTWGYLHWLDNRARASIRTQLAAGDAVIPRIARPTAEYYERNGTLHARVFGNPDSLDFLAGEPRDADDFWIASQKAGGGAILLPFEVDASEVLDPDHPEAGGMGLAVHVFARPREPTTHPATRPSVPMAAVDLRDAEQRIVVEAKMLTVQNSGRFDSPEGGRADVILSPEVLRKWLLPGKNSVMIGISGATVLADSPDFDYRISVDARPGGTGLYFPDPSGKVRSLLPGKPIYTGPRGRYGQQIFGQRADAHRPVAIYRFRNQAVPAAEICPFELRIVNSSADYGEDEVEEIATELSLTFRNRRQDGGSAANPAGPRVQDIRVFPENNRPMYFEVPSAAVAGGDFDVVVACRSPTWVTLDSGARSSLRIVVQSQSFAWNLVKSLLVLWLFSILVTITCVFCSTLVSWPIAIVLALLIVSGRWCVNELSDITAPGGGRQFQSQFLPNAGAALSRAVSSSVDALARLLDLSTVVLPDIANYTPLAELGRGAAVSSHSLTAAFNTTWMFGIPALVLGWIRLKYKEVAP